MLDLPVTRSGATVLPRGVRRALEAMRGNVGREWTVPELAAIAGGSSRTLQRLFKAFLGKTPREALRDIRFDCARRELLQGAADAKVMDVALRSGFTHFGRFSTEYRRVYGETPTETLKRRGMLAAGISSGFAFVSPLRDQPTVAVGPFERDADDGLAEVIADEVATTLTRAGVAGTVQASSARYRLAGTIRQSPLTPRLRRGDRPPSRAHRNGSVAGRIWQRPSTYDAHRCCASAVSTLDDRACLAQTGVRVRAA
jgi:AraC-like DNA-binding protein